MMMKAAISARYGSPDVLEIRQVPTPEPTAGEVLIKVQVPTFKPGDRAFGMSPDVCGAHAEYLCLPETAAMATMPVRAAFGEDHRAGGFVPHVLDKPCWSAGHWFCSRPSEARALVAVAASCAAAEVMASAGM